MKDPRKSCNGESCTSRTNLCTQADVPIRLMPYAKVGPVKTVCHNDGQAWISSSEPNSCQMELHIRQTVDFCIPIEYGAYADSCGVTFRGLSSDQT